MGGRPGLPDVAWWAVRVGDVGAYRLCLLSPLGLSRLRIHTLGHFDSAPVFNFKVAPLILRNLKIIFKLNYFSPFLSLVSLMHGQKKLLFAKFIPYFAKMCRNLFGRVGTGTGSGAGAK